MDIKDIYEVGSDIMDAVNEAVGSGDFSGLNETLKNVTGSAAGTAADALYGLKGRLQGGGENTQASGAGNAADKGEGAGSMSGDRRYGHAGRASGNVTEEYMKRAAGARHHTMYTSRVSPFLQRKISRGSGNGKIAGGIVSLVFAGLAFLDTVATGLLSVFSPFGGGFLTAWGIFSLVIAGGLAVLGGILIKSGNERKKLVREYYEYGKIAGTAEYIEIGKLAHAMGESRETVLDNLEKMMSEDMLPAAWFDRQKTTLMLSERMYNEYLRLERERQEQEAEEAMEKMAAGGQSGKAAQEELPEDLRLRPEDAKLPEEARKIVEEGLLYMGRIRRFNDLIGDEEVSDQLTQLETTMNRILEQIRKDPSSAPNLRRLMVYYLPTTMKLLEAYIELDSQPMAGENIVSTKHEIREALGTINEAFENLLDSLFQDMAWDISSDISVMKTMMAQDGLTGDRRIRRPVSGASGQAVPGTVQETGPEASLSDPQAYTDGYTEGWSEGFSASGTAAVSDTAAASNAAAQAQAQEEADGIHLTFGN